MNIHTTRIQRITITAPWEELDAAQSFIDYHGYTITARGGVNAPQMEIHAERQVDKSYAHDVTRREWAHIVPPPAEEPTP